MATVILHPHEGRTARDYALLYIGLGWKVFPIWSIKETMDGQRMCACPKGLECDRPGKHPMAQFVPGGVNDASGERGDVERWWGAFPGASIGIATGSTSGLTVIDADATGGKPGVINLSRLCAPHGGAPATFSVHTGGGGVHLYFKYNRDLPTGTNILDQAIDVRNDGGYVIAPPSLHILGNYRWRADTAELLDLPTWMRPTQREEQSRRRGPGRPRTRAGISIERAESLLRHVDPDDRDTWLRVGVILGRLYIGSPAEAEAWTLYESWSARSPAFDRDRAGSLARMREMFHDVSQEPTRAGQQPLSAGSLIQLAREGGWSPFGEKKVVPYEPGNEAAMCEGLIEALRGGRYFNVSGTVREVERFTIPSPRLINDATERGVPPPEALLVRAANTPMIQNALSRVAALVSADRFGEQKAIAIPAPLAGMILSAHAGAFPSLSGVVEWPIVRRGTMIRAKGYDEGTGLYFDMSPEIAIDETMTAEEAWGWIRDELFADFPFESDTHRAGALAMLLCFLQRPIMKTCPAFAVVAPQAGTGKSTLLEIASVSIHGQPIAPHAFSGDEEELRKTLHGLMLAKVPAVMFDNIGRGKVINSDHLAKLITSEVASDRILGTSDIRKESNTMLMTFTGNNIAFVKDMASRVIVIRMNARQTNPLGRTFRHRDIRRWSMDNRSRVLSALIAIAKLANGELPPAGRWLPTRFEDYDPMIVAPVLKVTGVDVRSLNVFASEPAEAEEDSNTQEALAMIWKWQQQWRGVANGEPWRTSELVEAIDGRSMPEEGARIIKRFAGSARDWEQHAARVLGYALRSVRDDYRYTPYLLQPYHGRGTTNLAKWEVKNSEQQQSPTDEAM